MSRHRRPLLAFAIPELDAGGPDRVIFELLKGLPRERFRLALIVQRSGGRYFGQLPGDVDVHLLDSPARYPVLQLAQLVRKIAPDLLMTTLRMNMAAGLAKPFMPGVRLVARQANAIAIDFAALKQTSLVKHRVAEQVVRFALRRADALIAQSQDMALELRRDGRAGQRVATIGNPVAVEEIERAAQAQAAKAPQPPGTPAIVAVGRLMEQKGYDLLITAMTRVIEAYPAAHLTILGEGPQRGALEAQAAAAGLKSSISLAGQSDAVFATVRAADLVVSSSRYEGFSNALLEAMALGCVVAATRCPGATAEMIQHGENGFLCPPGDAAALAECMLAALSSDRQRVGRAARAFVRRNYDRTNITDRYSALFDDVLAVADANRSGSPKKRASDMSTDNMV